MTHARIGIVWNPSKVEQEVLQTAVSGVFDDQYDIRWWETTPEDQAAAWLARPVRKAATS